MTSAALVLGCSLIAYTPAVSLLFIIAYSKAHLIIVITISAFAFLVSILISSLVWFPFKSLLKSTSSSAAFIIPTSVLIQAFFRCAFVYLYHRVEVVIHKSIERHEQSTSNDAEVESRSEAVSQQRNDLSETARLRYEINDFSCAIAGGVGFGGMHSVMLYGTLLASETGNMGTLYQSSCSFMPSLANAAVISLFFFFLDLLWMILTFYGMRRLFPTETSSRTSGNMSGALVVFLVVILHIAASCVTLINEVRVDGCKVSLPLLGGIVALTFAFVRFFIWSSYLSDQIRRR